MTPAFFLLLSFFAHGHVEIVRECPTMVCVDETVAQSLRYGLFRVRVFSHKPREGEMAPWVDPPLLDYQLQ